MYERENITAADECFQLNKNISQSMSFFYYLPTVFTKTTNLILKKERSTCRTFIVLHCGFKFKLKETLKSFASNKVLALIELLISIQKLRSFFINRNP